MRGMVGAAATTLPGAATSGVLWTGAHLHLLLWGPSGHSRAISSSSPVSSRLYAYLCPHVKPCEVVDKRGRPIHPQICDHDRGAHRG